MHVRTLLAAWGFLASILCLTCPAAPPNKLTEAERRGGWKLLVDGRTTNGWRNYRSRDLRDGWVVTDGALTRAKQGAGSIITVGQFEHFEFSLEYRIAKGGNSGVMFHVTEEEDQPWQSGPEVQILDNVAGGDEQESGWLYDLYQPVKPFWAIRFERQAGTSMPDETDATRRVGQWNRIYLRVARLAVCGVTRRSPAGRSGQ